MRAGFLLLCGVALACTISLRADAQQPPSAADLPGELRGGDIERALEARDWPRVEQLLASAVERTPRSREILLVLGRVFLADRKPLNAAIAFKKAEALGPLDERTRFALVLAYISMKRGDWARPELERLLAATPDNVVYEYWIGRLDYDAGQYPAALAHFQRVVGRDATFVRAYDNMGLCYEALNQPDSAIAEYHKAVELNRKDPAPSAWPPLNLAILLRHRGDLDQAQQLLTEAIRYEDALPQAHYQLGSVFEQSGRLDDAIRELKRAAELDATYADPHYALMRVYRRQGRTEDASQALATFQRLHDAIRKASPQ
jgi:tetratricopeptide (TPR) repeat protein